jgi:transposase-like protein
MQPYAGKLPDTIVVESTVCKPVLVLIRGIPKRAVVDGGSWYTVIEKPGIKRTVISGGIRNYIERWFKSFKRRIKMFDKSFPHKEGLVQHINN